MFCTWLNGIHKTQKIVLGLAHALWAMWNCRNDIVFNKSKCPPIGYPYGCMMNTSMVSPLTGGTGGHLDSGVLGFGRSCSGYLQWAGGGIRIPFEMFVFLLLIHVTTLS